MAPGSGSGQVSAEPVIWDEGGRFLQPGILGVSTLEMWSEWKEINGLFTRAVSRKMEHLFIHQIFIS